jgi:hypothetical protein
LQSIIGSLNVETCPLASQIFGDMMMVASRPATSSRRRVIVFHHCSFTLRFNSAPSGTVIPEMNPPLMPP